LEICPAFLPTVTVAETNYRVSQVRQLYNIPTIKGEHSEFR